MDRKTALTFIQLRALTENKNKRTKTPKKNPRRRRHGEIGKRKIESTHFLKMSPSITLELTAFR